MIRILAAAALASAAILPAGAQTAGERLVQPALAGFVVAHRLERGPNLIEERVPRGETTARWTRMVTVQRFGGGTNRTTPDGLLARMAQGFAQACPAGRFGAVATLTVEGRPAAQMRADCPRLQETGLPESFFVRAVAGAADLHIVQVAFRRVPTAADTAFAEAYLAGVALCAPASRGPLCARR